MGTQPAHGLTDDEFAGCVGFNFFRNSVSRCAPRTNSAPRALPRPIGGAIAQIPAAIKYMMGVNLYQLAKAELLAERKTRVIGPQIALDPQKVISETNASRMVDSFSAPIGADDQQEEGAAEWRSMGAHQRRATMTIR